MQRDGDRNGRSERRGAGDGDGRGDGGEIDAIRVHLAGNLRRLREGRGLSQQRMAELAGIPRPTWTSLEAGGANPTLSVLVRAATALQVPIDELVAAPRSSAQLLRASEVPVRRRQGVALRALLPESIAGLEIERMELPPGGAMVGVPHTPGTREFLTCERGRVELSAAGESWRLEAGDALAFRADQRHGYRNLDARRVAVAISVVCFAPSAR